MLSSCFHKAIVPAHRTRSPATMTFISAQQASASAAPQQQQQSPDLLGLNSKTILLIRHGLGFHNIGYDHNLDAHLTARGWAQTAALQQHLQALQPQLGIQLVVVSPLRRTLETAAGVFGAQAPPATAAAAAQKASAATAATAAAAAAGHHPSWTLMHPQPGRPYEATPQQMLYLPPVQRRAVIAAAGAAAAGVAATAAGSMGSSGARTGGLGGEAGAVGDDQQPLKLLAHEGCRERIGPNVCDKFRPISQQAADFPGVDFSLMQHSTDEMWEALHAATCQDGGCYLSGEEERHCEQRALDFYAWLLDRPESVIAVVSHCGFLVHGMRALGKGMFKAWGDAMMQQLKANGSTSNTSALPGAAAGPVNGYIPAVPDASYFASPGLSPNPLGAQADLSPPDSNTSSAGGSAPDLAAQAAEVVRQSAADLTGWMAADWMNCECRSIQLAWGSSAQLLSGPAATAAGRAGPGPGADWFLFAKPGDGAAWFPGGM